MFRDLAKIRPVTTLYEMSANKNVSTTTDKEGEKEHKKFWNEVVEASDVCSPLQDPVV